MIPTPVEADRRRPWYLPLVVHGTIVFLLLILIGAWADIGRPFSGFFVQAWGNVIPVTGLAPNDAVGVHFRDLLVEIDGRPFKMPEGYWARIERHAAAGTVPEYTFERQGQRFQLSLPTRPLTNTLFAETMGSFILAGLVYAVIGYVVYRARPDLEAAQAFTLFACAAAVIAMELADSRLHQRFLPAGLAFSDLIGGTMVRLSLVFPQRLPWAERPWIRRAPMLVSGVVALIHLGVYLVHRLHLHPDSARWGLAWGDTAYLWLTICFFTAVTFFAKQARQGDWVARRQLQIVSLGALTGITPLAFCYLLPRALGAEPWLPLDVSILLTCLMPLSVAFAIVRYGMWDVRMLVRQGLTALALITTLAVLYFSAVGILEITILADQARVEWAEFIAGVLIAMAFAPLRDRIHRKSAKFFMRQPYDAQTVLETTAQSLATTLDVDRIAEQVMELINDTLHPVGGCLLIIDDETERFEPIHTFGLGPSLSLPVDSPVVQGVLANRLAVSRSAMVTRRLYLLQPMLREIGAELLIPLVYEEKLLGMLLLGAKRNEAPYNDTDIGLLRALAGQAALALHNARQVFTVRQINQRLEQMVADRTKALEDALAELQGTQARLVQSEKMVSLGLLVAGVAHEINNPAAVVIGNLELMKEAHLDVRRLLDAFDGLELTTHMAELIGSIKQDVDYPHRLTELEAMTRDCVDAARRIRAIVADLRTFSRPRGDALQPVDVRNGLTTTLNLVRSLFKDRIALNGTLADVPVVLGDSSQLNQVFMNLLVNAAQAITGKGAVDVALWSDADWIYLSVTDTGCGIPADNLPRLFDPFFTTKRQGEGTGLGLSITYGIVQRHGGRIDVNSTVGEGSTFTVVLPVYKSSARSTQPTT